MSSMMMRPIAAASTLALLLAAPASGVPGAGPGGAAAGVSAVVAGPRGAGLESRRWFGASAPAAGGEILVKFRTGVPGSTMAAAHAREGAAIRYRSRATGWQALRLPPGADPSAALARYRLDPSIEAAEWVLPRRVAKKPNDLRQVQWGLHNTGSVFGGVADADVDAPEAWNLSVGSRDVIVAVIDTGVDTTRGDLSSRLVPGIDYVSPGTPPDDDNGHGTSVASVLGAVGNNDSGMTGVNWKVSIMPIKACDASGYCDGSAIIAGIDYAAANGAKVLNLSLSCDENDAPTFNCVGAAPGSCATQAERDAVAAAGAAGAVVVDASGNCGSNNDDATSSYPCGHDLDNNICAGATTPDDSAAAFSNVGPQTVDVGAPGELILAYDVSPPGGTFLVDGTSVATPMVAGVAALLVSRTLLAPAAVRSRILEGGDDAGVLALSFAAGRLNAFNALKDVLLPPAPYAAFAPQAANLLADVDRDGRADFVQGIAGSGFWVERARSKNYLRSSTRWSGTRPADAALAGDVDGDRREDVIVGDALAGWKVLRSTGSDFFPEEVWSTSPPGALNAAGDFDGDGLTDVLRHTGAFEVLLSTGTSVGGFEAPQVWSSDPAGDAIAAADLDGDGRDDAVNWTVTGSTSRIDVGLSDGTGFGTLAPWLDAQPLDPNGSLDFAGACDLDGDGLDDLVGLDAVSGCLMVLRSTGSGLEDARPWICADPYTRLLTGRADMSRDARCDVVVYDTTLSWRMLRSVR